VADIGGTNARFALACPDTGGFTNEQTFKCRDYASPELAIRAYLDEQCALQPNVICIAAAGPVIEGKVLFTNNNWSLETEYLASAFPGSRVRLINDFEAIAYSLPHLRETDSLPIGTVSAPHLGDSDYNLAVLGPGTGLGTAGLCRRNGHIFPIIGEGGHIGFAPETQQQTAILDELRKKFEHVCDEHLLSGPGIINIHQALAAMSGIAVTQTSAAEIFLLASSRTDKLCITAVDIFFEVLGQVAGNLALSLGAYQGVFIAGGIVAQNPQLVVNSRFRKGFEAKGRHSRLMEKISTRAIVHPNPGLLGATHCAMRMMLND
jgi:glucokinase